MDGRQELLELYEIIRPHCEAWKRQLSEEHGKDAREVLRDALIEQLTLRFERALERALARIHEADLHTLVRWAFQINPAETLHDVLT